MGVDPVPYPEPGDLVKTVVELVTAVNAGGGVILGRVSNMATADSVVTILCDGDFHDASVTMAEPPDWLDTGGLIVSPGLYVINASLYISVPLTASGLYAFMDSPFGAKQVIPLDGIQALGINVALTDVLSLGADDLPRSTSCLVKAQSDVTGQLNIQMSVSRLAWN